MAFKNNVEYLKSRDAKMKRLLSRVQGNQRMKYKNMYFSVNVGKYLAIFFNSHIIMSFDETIFSSKL